MGAVLLVGCRADIVLTDLQDEIADEIADKIKYDCFDTPPKKKYRRYVPQEYYEEIYKKEPDAEP